MVHGHKGEFLIPMRALSTAHPVYRRLLLGISPTDSIAMHIVTFEGKNYMWLSRNQPRSLDEGDVKAADTGDLRRGILLFDDSVEQLHPCTGALFGVSLQTNVASLTFQDEFALRSV
jgi:hypothetical protein